MARKILHLDLDAFFCSVEEQYDPSLKGRPFAVGGLPEERGVVSSCSYAARMCGVRSAMPMGQAMRQCPQLLIVPPHHEWYSLASQSVMDLLHSYTPLLEQISIDEAFLDLSDLPESGQDLALRIQATVRDRLHLPCSLGIATNKLVAKIATDVGKSAARKGEPPFAITVVPPGQEATFLAPLPVIALWGVGPKTAAKLGQLGLHTIGDIAGWPEADLRKRFGKNGHDLWLHAQGIDDSPLVTTRNARSISQEVTFSRDLKEAEQLRKTLWELSAGVGRQLRQAGLCGSTVKLKLRWPDFTTLGRQIKLALPSDQDQDIYQAALTLFEREWRPGRAVRLLGVGVTGLGPPARQLSLFDRQPEKDRRLQAVVDELRQRYGDRAAQRGRGKK